jgi:drug/metabolite transporter (DMT)-like permease
MIWAVELSETSQVSLLLRSDIIFSALIGFLFFGERISRQGISGLLLMSAGAFLVLRMLPWQLQVPSNGDMLAVLAGFLLSTNAIIIKYGLAKVPDEVIAFYNVGLVTILSFVIVIFSGSLESYLPLKSPLIAGLSGLAVLLSSSMFLLYYKSLALHPVWLVRAFLLLSPFVTMVLSGWVLNEKVLWSQWVGGVLLAAGGTVLLREAKGEPKAGIRG